MLKWQPVLKGIDSLNEWTGKITSYVLAGMFSVIMYEVTCRYVFNKPTIWGHELTMLLMAFYTIMGGGYALLTKSHVVMDLVHNRLSLRSRGILDATTSVFLFFWCAVLLWGGTIYAAIAVSNWEHYPSIWNPPVWQSKVAIPVGVTLLLLQGIAKLVRDAYIAVKGRELK